ncbi:MAG: hypothetical protein NZO16_06395 [Deltaproteobacteria bacterium]|nr:hypothetical protein [Deltaproteobacteria bacterium]
MIFLGRFIKRRIPDDQMNKICAQYLNKLGERLPEGLEMRTDSIQFIHELITEIFEQSFELVQTYTPVVIRALNLSCEANDVCYFGLGIVCYQSWRESLSDEQYSRYRLAWQLSDKAKDMLKGGSSFSEYQEACLCILAAMFLDRVKMDNQELAIQLEEFIKNTFPNLKEACDNQNHDSHLEATNFLHIIVEEVFSFIRNRGELYVHT